MGSCRLLLDLVSCLLLSLKCTKAKVSVHVCVVCVVEGAVVL